MRLPQDQWDWIFDYAFTLLISMLYAALLWWFDASWWLAVLIVHFQAFTWKRSFTPAERS